ncbi:NADH pyrophosphatase, partial [Francisella noatunensis subsp. orientalis]|nr:NADH pyrophosphatase [Francisella orientalis]NIY52964.1 NADH pyrophosphatase [Francisella orientalis]NIY58927.1 NADH pyrophosphatase [Francisella orientalis]
QFDEEEFNNIRWFHLDEVPHSKSDPHMERFIQKFKGNL